MADNLMTLADTLNKTSRFGDQVAFQDEKRSESFNSFSKRVSHLISALHRNGIRKGDRVALLSRNSVSAVEWIFAACAGFIVVPLNWRLSPLELQALVKDCAPRAIVCDADYQSIIDETIINDQRVDLKITLETSRKKGWLSYKQLLKSSSDEPFRPPSTYDPAFIIYTSGTTGTPKGVIITHRALSFNICTAGKNLVCANATDRSLMVMPMFHVGGLCFYLLAGFLYGTTTILRPTFDREKVVTALRDERITNVHLVPTMIADLAAHPEIQNATKTLKRILYAGSTMPLALLERAMNTFNECEFVQGYGSTEGGAVASLGHQEHADAATYTTKLAHLSSCGQPLPNVKIKIIREDNSLCGPGEPGEVAVQSPGIMQGYWCKTEQTNQALRDGYLHMGDIGYFDEDGYLYLMDRKHDMIVTGGENVFPAEVEQIFYRCPEIAEAAVFGIPDSKWIEKIVVAIRLNENSNLTEKNIIEFARKHLAPYKCPKHVMFMSELPRTGVGKVSRKNLKLAYAKKTEISI